jgi:HEAT repeat protein
MLLVASLALAAVCQSPGSPAESAPAEGATVERLIEEARLRVERSKTATSGRWSQLLAELDLDYEKEPARVDAAVSEILTLGEGATRGLVDTLRGPKGSRVAKNAQRALVKSTAENVVAELETALGSSPTLELRERVAWVLGRRQGDRPPAILRVLLTDSEPTVAGQAAASLGLLKVKDAAPAIAERLAGAGPTLGQYLLVALSSLEDPRVVPQIVAFVESRAGGECAAALASVVKSLRAKELLVPALRVVQRGGSATEDAAELVRSVEKVIQPSDRDALAILKKILGDSGIAYEVKEECAYALHAAKDSAGKNWLLQPVNDAIRDNPDGAALLRSRARIYMRLKLYKEAQRDFDEIKRLSAGGRKITLDGDFWVDAARASSGGKSYQVAADALRNALGLGVRPKFYRDHPEFTEMKKVAKYASLFEGD